MSLPLAGGVLELEVAGTPDHFIALEDSTPPYEHSCVELLKDFPSPPQLQDFHLTSFQCAHCPDAIVAPKEPHHLDLDLLQPSRLPKYCKVGMGQHLLDVKTVSWIKACDSPQQVVAQRL